MQLKTKPSVSSSHSRDNIFILCILLLTAYMLYFKIPFPGTDEIIYKEPAFRISSGLSFASPAVTGVHPGIDTLFVHYPQGYPYSLGLWFKIFGFSISSSLLFSYFISFSILVLLLYLYRSSLSQGMSAIAYGFIFVSWSIAILAADRPDSLEILALLIVLIFLRSKYSILKGSDLILCLLICLAILISPMQAILALPYLFFHYLEIKKLKVSSFVAFIAVSLGGIVLALSVWSTVFLSDPSSFKRQFIDSVLDVSKEASQTNPVDGIRFMMHYGYLYCYLPLLFILFLRTVFSKKEKSENHKFFLLQFFSLAMIWGALIFKVQTKYTYLNVFYIFFLYILGVNDLNQRRNFGNQKLNFTVLFCIILAAAPLLRMILIPLSWNSMDFYEYNKKRILETIPEGKTVLTDPRFWHLLGPNHRVYDMGFSPQEIYRSDYLLLSSGGSGKSGQLLLNLDSVDSDYFHKHFYLKDSTVMKDEEANHIFGFPITKSRWSYRYALYERKAVNPVERK